MDQQQVKNIVEGALLSAGKPLTVDQLFVLFTDADDVDKEAIRAAIKQLGEDFADRGIELKKVASGFRLQVKSTYSPWISRLWEEKPPRYSRAFMETLALIAYRQPITRGEIEEIRGVTVSTNIVRTMLDHDWIKIIGHRDVPGKPALYGTTKHFLDSFNLKSLDELPSLAEIRDLEEIGRELGFEPEKKPEEQSGQETLELEVDGAGDEASPDTDSGEVANEEPASLSMSTDPDDAADSDNNSSDLVLEQIAAREEAASNAEQPEPGAAEASAGDDTEAVDFQHSEDDRKPDIAVSNN